MTGMFVFRMFIGIASLFLFGCSESYVNYPPKLSGDWVAFGDSLTLGYGVGSSDSYPSGLSRLSGRPILNLGRSGRTSAEGLLELDSVPTNAGVVFLCLGGNDGLQGLSQDQMFGNLSRIIDSLHLRGSFVVLIGVRGVGLVDSTRAGFERLAREKSVFYIPDILAGVFGNPALMVDHIHPNAQGYSVISHRLYESLSKLEGLW